MKKVFISGSTRGIGRETALEFARNGYCVILNGRSKNKKSEQILADIKKISPDAEIYYFDVSDKNKVKQNCQKILKKHGSLDVLVNNAGIIKDSSFIKMSNEDWDKVIKTNLYGSFNLIKNFLPAMIKKHYGRIINISSVVALTGNFGQANYAASKAGLLGLTKSLSRETARYNITVNAVCPGFTKTEMTASIPKDILEKKILPKIPAGRLCDPREIAKLILFLSSEESGYINGECININGGMF